MFNKELLLINSSGVEYLLIPGVITKASRLKEVGYYPSKSIGKLSPPNIDGKKIFKLSGATSKINDRNFVSLYCLLEPKEEYQTSSVYFGLPNIKQYTFKLNPYTPPENARGWYAMEANKKLERWAAMQVLVGTLQELALRGEVGPFYLSTTPPPWGYTA